MAKKQQAWHGKEPPNLANATPSMLIDEVGIRREKIKALQTEEKFFSEALKARMTGNIVEGEKYSGLLVNVSQERVSTTLLKEKYPDIAAEVTTPVNFQQLKTTPKG